MSFYKDLGLKIFHPWILACWQKINITHEHRPQNSFTQHMFWFPRFQLSKKYFGCNCAAIPLSSHIVAAQSKAFILLWSEFSTYYWPRLMPCVISHCVTTLYNSRSSLICGHKDFYSALETDDKSSMMNYPDRLTIRMCPLRTILHVV
jgi:hypothetical protein